MADELTSPATTNRAPTREEADDGLLFVLKVSDSEWLESMVIRRKGCSFRWAKTSGKALRFDRTLACTFAAMLEDFGLSHVPVEVDDHGRVKS